MSKKVVSLILDEQAIQDAIIIRVENLYLKARMEKKNQEHNKNYVYLYEQSKDIMKNIMKSSLRMYCAVTI